MDDNTGKIIHVDFRSDKDDSKTTFDSEIERIEEEIGGKGLKEAVYNIIYTKINAGFDSLPITITWNNELKTCFILMHERIDTETQDRLEFISLQTICWYTGSSCWISLDQKIVAHGTLVYPQLG